MTRARFKFGKSYTRRRFLTLAAGLGAAAAFPVPPVHPAGPVLTRPIPRTRERLPVIGLGTAVIFDIGEDAAARAERRAVIQTMLVQVN